MSEPGTEPQAGAPAERRKSWLPGRRGSRRCIRCGRQLDAGAARCEACGAIAPAPGERRRSRGVLATIALVLLAVLLTLLVERPPGGLQLVSYRSADLAVLVPSGYMLTPASAPFGTAVAVWIDPANPATSLTVQARSPAGASPARRAATRYAELRRLTDFVGRAPVAVSFPGGRRAVLLEYSLDGEAHALFEFTACAPAITMAVSLTASSFRTLDELEVVVPQNAEPICDGPSFTGRDRADPAIPLRTAH